MIPFSQFKVAKTSGLPLREQYFRGMIFTPGQFVTDGKSSFEILECGPNYVTVVDGNGSLSKKFITSIHLSEKIVKSGGMFKGYVPKTEFSSEIFEAFSRTIRDYTVGKINDPIAILKAIAAIDEGRTNDAFVSLKRIGQANNHQYLQEVQEMNKNKIELATKIAHQFGGDYCESPEKTIEMVLESLVHINHTSAQAAAKQVIELAEEAQIEIDEKFDKHSFIGKIIRGNEANNKGWGTLGDAFRSKTPEEARKASRKGNRYYNMVNKKKGSHTDGGFPKTQVPGLGKVDESILQPGDMVTVNKKYSQAQGKVLFNHGTVVEVKHNNGKVSFHPHATVQKNEISNTPTPVQKSQLNTIATLGAKSATDPKTGVIGPQVQDNKPGVKQTTKFNVIQPSPAVLAQTKNTLLGNI